MSYPRIASLKTADDFQSRLDELEITLPFDRELIAGSESPLAQPYAVYGQNITNRFSILPMEGWDGTRDGHATELTLRRWKNFGLSGAKLIWGGEAVAVCHEGRANPNQLLINDQTLPDLIKLRETLQAAHQSACGSLDGLFVGLQLTHSGRFARPNVKTQLEPKIAYRHPILDAKVGIEEETAILSDDELKRLCDDFVEAAKRAGQAGYQFVDIKQCHGYLGHELLSGYDRPGKFGGSFENRTRFIREIVAGIRAEVPEMQLATRISIFDFTPFEPGEDFIGIPSGSEPYRYAFGGDYTGTGIDLTEPHQLLRLMEELGVTLICLSCGSPYYNPHIQRPALFPPSDGYQPPEDPLVGVARQIQVTAELKKQHPNMVFVGSGYSYLQEWLANVGQHAVAHRMVDVIGLGRMVLSYPELPIDVLSGQTMKRRKICRTFSDCTTAPRNGIVSGCYPLDPHYKAMPERQQLQQFKQVLK